MELVCQLSLQGTQSCFRFVLIINPSSQSGVPQGSVLGPLLSLVNVNDIFQAISPSHLLLFADDAQYFRRVNCTSDCFLLRQDLEAISDWSDKWNLKFNVSKSGYVRFGSVSPDSFFTINGT